MPSFAAAARLLKGSESVSGSEEGRWTIWRKGRRRGKKAERVVLADIVEENGLFRRDSDSIERNLVEARIRFAVRRRRSRKVRNATT